MGCASAAVPMAPQAEATSGAEGAQAEAGASALKRIPLAERDFATFFQRYKGIK